MPKAFGADGQPQLPKISSVTNLFKKITALKYNWNKNNIEINSLFTIWAIEVATKL